MTMAKRTRRTLVYGRYRPKTDERVLFRHVRRIIFNPAQCPPCGVEFCSLSFWGAHNPLIRRYFLGVFRFAQMALADVRILTHKVIGIKSWRTRRLSRWPGQA